MAMQIKRIEKDFLLKAAYEGQTLLMGLMNRAAYSFIMEKPAGAEMCLTAKQIIPGLKEMQKLSLLFDWRDQVISFSVDILSMRHEHIVAKAPEALYKNLTRSYARAPRPQGISLQLIKPGLVNQETIEGKRIDISVSGILFAYPFPILSALLGPKSSELSLRIALPSPPRSIAPNARIVRRYKDNAQHYFGCRFLELDPEDTRHLFEGIYGRPFNDTGAAFLSGQV
jgi:c-di-GMP-binding flagellar brake protein YcgR